MKNNSGIVYKNINNNESRIISCADDDNPFLINISNILDIFTSLHYEELKYFLGDDLLKIYVNVNESIDKISETVCETCYNKGGHIYKFEIYTHDYINIAECQSEYNQIKLLGIDEPSDDDIFLFILLHELGHVFNNIMLWHQRRECKKMRTANINIMNKYSYADFYQSLYEDGKLQSPLCNSITYMLDMMELSAGLYATQYFIFYRNMLNTNIPKRYFTIKEEK